MNGDDAVTGRGNNSFTSINLPRIAIEAANITDDPEKRIEIFYKRLDEMLDLVRDQLLERMYFQGTATKENFTFLMGQGIWKDSENLEPGEPLAEVIKHGTLTIGFIGLAETLKALIGKHHGESEEAQKLGLEIVGRMRCYTDKMTERYKLNFGIIGTPKQNWVAK